MEFCWGQKTLIIEFIAFPVKSELSQAVCSAQDGYKKRTV